MIKVLIYDDKSALRSSIQSIVNSSDGIVCVGSFADANQVKSQIEEYAPDVVLMDINMPGINGIEATQIIKKTNPNIKVLIQTIFDDDDSIFESIRAGAEGYLLKSSSADRILKGIEDVHYGGAIMTPSIALRVMNFFQPTTESNKTYNLTSRESEVLLQLTKGLSYKMIASTMSITYNTVNAHIRNIYEKLQVNSSTEAVTLALKKGIV